MATAAGKSLCSPKRTGVIACALTFAACLPPAHPAAAQAPMPCGYEIAHIIQGPYCNGVPPTQAAGISPNGRYVVGYYTVCTVGYPRGFIYDTLTSQMTVLPHPSGTWESFVNDVNDAGLAVGSLSGYNGTGSTGFVYDIHTGQFTFVPPGVPSGGSCSVNAINSSGVCAGTRTIQTSPTKRSAFIFSAKSSVSDIGLIYGEITLGWDISDNGMLVGHFPENSLSASARAFVHLTGSTTVLDAIPNGVNSRTRACAPSGETVITGMLTTSPSGPSAAYLNVASKYVYSFAMPGACSGQPLEMNSSRVAVGTACSDTLRGVVWFGTQPRTLSDLLLPPGAVNWVEMGIAISENGHIAANVFAGPQWDLAVGILAPIPRGPGDTNCDKHVNVSDLLNVINTWGPCNGCDPDLNQDGLVNVADLLNVIQHWSP